LLDFFVFVPKHADRTSILFLEQNPRTTGKEFHFDKVLTPEQAAEKLLPFYKAIMHGE